MKRNKNREKPYIQFSWHDCAVTVLLLAAVSGLAFLLRLIDKSDSYVPMLFIFAVFLISRYTHGYLFGFIGSVIGIILVNYIFTYPYFAFNFTISGYPITFICMFMTSFMTSAMTTQIKNHEKVYLEAEKEKMRGNLLRAVSHDLRTPLTSIVGTTSALLDNGDKISSQQQQKLIQECHDDAEWLIRMVENLLSITRMSGDEAKIYKSLEAAEEIVGEAVRKFQKRFNNVNVSVSVPDDILFIPMDAILIEQVLLNLLENSVLHGKNTDGISLSAEKAGSNAIFTVSDHGVGIPESAFRHLFDGYLSEKNVQDSDNKRSLGIGLSVCMSIVKLHGGNMTARNKPEGGAEFSFTLPLKE